LRERAAELRCRGDVPVEWATTGGTTGEPITVTRDLAGTVWQRACYWRGFGWGGLRIGEPFVQLFGGTLGVSEDRPLESVKRWSSGRTFLPAFEMSPANVDRPLDAIRASKARFLVGYTSAVYLLARHATRRGDGIGLDAVFPTAEPLLDG